MRTQSDYFRRTLAGIAAHIAFISVLSFTVIAAGQEPGGTFISVLVDFSRSFAPLTAEDESALQELGKAIKAASEESWEGSVTVRYYLIGTSSVFSKQPCGTTVFLPRLIPSKGEINNKTDFGRILDECAIRVVKLSHQQGKVESYTDITGAIRVAAAIKTAPMTTRIIVLVSDFVEDHPPDFTPVVLRMQGEHCVLLYRPEAGDLNKPDRMFARIADWSAKLLKAGAKSVEAAQVTGISAGEIRQLLPR